MEESLSSGCAHPQGSTLTESDRRPTTVTNTWTRRRILLLPVFFVEIEVAAEVATGLVTVLVTTGSYPVRRPAADREQAWLPVQAGQKRGFPGGNPLFLLSSGRPRRQ